jgi:hypothetical protein
MFTFNRSVMRTAIVTVNQDGNVQIVRKLTMVQAEASIIWIVRLLPQQQPKFHVLHACFYECTGKKFENP